MRVVDGGCVRWSFRAGRLRKRCGKRRQQIKKEEAGLRKRCGKWRKQIIREAGVGERGEGAGDTSACASGATRLPGGEVWLGGGGEGVRKATRSPSERLSLSSTCCRAPDGSAGDHASAVTVCGQRSANHTDVGLRRGRLAGATQLARSHPRAVWTVTGRRTRQAVVGNACWCRWRTTKVPAAAAARGVFPLMSGGAALRPRVAGNGAGECRASAAALQNRLAPSFDSFMRASCPCSAAPHPQAVGAGDGARVYRGGGGGSPATHRRGAPDGPHTSTDGQAKGRARGCGQRRSGAGDVGRCLYGEARRIVAPTALGGWASG